MCLIAGGILEGSWSSLAVGIIRRRGKLRSILRSTPFRVSSRIYSGVRGTGNRYSVATHSYTIPCRVVSMDS